MEPWWREDEKKRSLSAACSLSLSGSLRVGLNTKQNK